MKFLIAGLGSIGRRHLRNLISLGQRDILLYRTHHSTLPDDKFGVFPVETDLDTALSHYPDAVIISNPTALHLDVAIPAAQAGCHLFLEKPISHSMARVDELKAAIARAGVQVHVGYQFRFHPGLIHARRMLTEGVIGKTLSARAHWGEYLPGWHPWEDYRQGYSARPDLGGGAVLTLSHPLDYLRWLLGEVSALWAFTAQRGELEIEVEDSAEIGLRFADGTLGSVHLDYCQRPPAHHLEIVGTRGTLQWDNADGFVRVYITDEERWITYPLPEGFERNQLFLAQMRHFLEVVEEDVEPVCTLDDGVKTLQIALGAHQSRENGELVYPEKLL